MINFELIVRGLNSRKEHKRIYLKLPNVFLDALGTKPLDRRGEVIIKPNHKMIFVKIAPVIKLIGPQGDPKQGKVNFKTGLTNIEK